MHTHSFYFPLWYRNQHSDSKSHNALHLMQKEEFACKDVWVTTTFIGSLSLIFEHINKHTTQPTVTCINFDAV